jgi:hypothetical protein
MLCSFETLQAQCGSGFTQTNLNWDNLDYYYNSGSNTAPYGNSSGTYITDAQEMTQKFGFGKTFLTIATSSNALVNATENISHTGELAGYTGADVQYNPSSGGQTITFTFNDVVQNVSFALYDIDASMQVTIAGVDALGLPITVNATPQATTILTIGLLSTSRTITASSSTAGNTANTGSAIVNMPGSVKQFTITVNTVGSDAIMWLSDMTACVSGTFPINYHQMPGTQPINGLPDYFIVTPDNNSVYMLDHATGQAYFLFQDASNTYVNSFAYDQVNKILYYISEAASANASNKNLKKYDFVTGTTSIVGNITTLLGIPTFDQGVQSGGAAFYDGALYIGIEGGRFSSSVTRESIIWRINFSGLTPTTAYQVWACNAYNSSTILHDWADFLVRDGIIYDFNSAKNGSPADYTNSNVVHYNMVTGQQIVYPCPDPTLPFVGQGSMDWSGNLYSIRNVVERYNMNGGLGSPVTIVAVTGPSWVGNAGDGSEPFRPAMDFGDAPTSFEPAVSGQAAHDVDVNLRLGASMDREYDKTGSGALADADGADEDGLPYVQIFNPAYGNYLTSINVFNNTGADATMCAWLDHNGDGDFDLNEGITVTVPTSATTQSVYLYWPSIISPLANGSYTYMRVRIARATAGMTTAVSGNYYGVGEVEDYRVPVNSFPLATAQLRGFEAKLTSPASVQLKWNVMDDSETASYIIERSSDRTTWEMLQSASVNADGKESYTTVDDRALTGVSFYRIRMLAKDGRMQYSEVRKVENNGTAGMLTVLPNPVRTKGSLQITSYGEPQTGIVEIVDAKGAIIHKDQLAVNKGTTTYALPLGARMPAGQYIARVRLGQTVLVTNVIVTK